MKLTSQIYRHKARLELSTAAMIDVVFLLLIFFLVTTTFLRPERLLRPAIKVQQTNAARPSDFEPAIVDVVRIEGVPQFRIVTLVTGDLEQLSSILASFENKQDGAFVRVADDVPFEMAAQAINACRENGFGVVSYVPLQ